MNTRLANLAADHGGAFTRAQALTCGYNDDDIYRLTGSGDWTRLRRGAFCTTADLPADDAERHLLQAHAVLLSLGPRVALSHTSAAIALGLPVWVSSSARSMSPEWTKVPRAGRPVSFITSRGFAAMRS